MYLIVLPNLFFNASFKNSHATRNQTNRKQLERLRETDHLLQNQHTHLLPRNQVLIKF